jgi:hypothetical protein
MLEVFEEWQKKALKHGHSPNVPYGAKKGWKAALEWVEDILIIDSGSRELLDEELGNE